ncbi:uncharacterized protein EV420DRAFT_92617 [Desarmillaria tabescens]|uniref:Uncharacterized protein n=1 Tax=Armillaria tabescens TaxID=1929756 RepID=A0AA39NQS9_ARMTA|nr:uncharacterized protein EV420DRAFT_92617 [Desarmillaria tabescens]KAK0470147.1 hypothetical protein EV420DRAFT_92617 [Desarmillaria tabescens]
MELKPRSHESFFFFVLSHSPTTRSGVVSIMTSYSSPLLSVSYPHPLSCFVLAMLAYLTTSYSPLYLFTYPTYTRRRWRCRSNSPGRE